MFNFNSFRSVVCAGLCALAAGITTVANATLMPNPAPVLLFDDVGAELITPTPTMAAQFVTNPLGADVGFYFAGDPTTVVPIFVGTDPASIDPTVAAAAVIDFSAGQVIDSATNTVVRTFTPQPGQQIGFYGRAFLFPSVRTVYSEAALNGPPITGEDVVGTFPLILDSSIEFIGFFGPAIFRPASCWVVWAYNLLRQPSVLLPPLLRYPHPLRSRFSYLGLADSHGGREAV